MQLDALRGCTAPRRARRRAARGLRRRRDGLGRGPSVVDVPWSLAEGVDVDGWEAVAPSAVFDGTTMTGSTGCNRYTGAYTADGETLELGRSRHDTDGLSTTGRHRRAGLPRPARAGRGVAPRGAELVLVDDTDTELLRFREATPVGAWESSAIRTATAVTSPLPGTSITAHFESDGTLSGSAGCNGYRASFTTERGAITIGPAAATKKACAEPDGVMEQEAAFLESLPTAARYLVDGSVLSLLRADGTIVASFTRI